MAASTAARPVIFLLGPTASGKTTLAIELAQALPVDIVSVDSALVYREMDIGTAKPSAAERARAPHSLIDILDPAEAYSAGKFVRDARREIGQSHSRGRIPLLVGGTMLYFQALEHGLADLPDADPAIRSQLDAQAARRGWAALHSDLAALDPETAARLAPSDRQRIQRALEVHLITGKPLSALRREAQDCGLAEPPLKLALPGGPRQGLHQRIEQRFNSMIRDGFVDEVAALHGRGDLSPQLPSMRAVGYRQLWAHVAGETDLASASERVVVATRQLAKRQLTWLRSMQGLEIMGGEPHSCANVAKRLIEDRMGL